MLILLCGDAHITGRSPIARLDDLVTVQFEKWKEIISIANQYNCPIISTGDIFNTAIIANSILSKFGDILNNLNTSLFFVWGNHDLLYHNLDMLERTSLGMLKFNNPKIKHISEFKDFYNVDWSYIDWNQPVANKKTDFLLTHQAIVTTRMIGGKNSWIAKDREFARNIETDKELQKYKLIICGHWHKKYQIKYKETTIINPGPITRLTVDDKEEPTVQLINLKTKIKKTVHLESVMPTENVISDKHLEYNIHRTKTDVPFIKEFIDTLKNNQIKLSSSFMNNLMAILDSHELDKKVENILRELISIAIEKKAIVLE